MGEELKIWAFIIGNVGLPVSIVVWYFTIERPNQRKREDKLVTDMDAKWERFLVEERKYCDDRRAEDRIHSLEIAKLSGEIHLTASRELREGYGRHTEAIERMEARFESVLEIFSDGVAKVTSMSEEIKKRKP
jgi:hypothetical protein